MNRINEKIRDMLRRDGKGPNYFVIIFLFCIVGFIAWLVLNKDDQDRNRIVSFFEKLIGAGDDNQGHSLIDDEISETMMFGTNYHYDQLSESEKKSL